MITVACVFVKGHVPFTPEYVTNLRSMVARHLKRAHKFVCLTDRPELFHSDMECINIDRLPKSIKGWWAKMAIFDPSLDLGDRVLYLDLDTLIVDALDPIVDYPTDFALIPHSGNFAPGSHLIVRKFNSSVMVFDPVTVAPLFKYFDIVDDTNRYWGDQDLIGDRMPNADVMPLEWFPRLSELKEQAPLPPAKVVLAKVPKNTIAAKLYPWFATAWRAA